MSLQLENLDEQTRLLMVEELDLDLKNGALYMSNRLSGRGHDEYEGLLRTALSTGDDESLANEIRSRGCLNLTEQRRKSSGGFSTVKVPVTAPDTLAEGEFNRFYARGLCRKAIDNGIGVVEIYRAKPVGTPRSASQEKIGHKIDAKALLDDLRSHPGVDTSLGLPAGPNSGLSVRLP